MKKMTFVLLAALAIVVTSCKPKETDVSLSMTNGYDADVMNTLLTQYSTDSATMLSVVCGLGYTEYIKSVKSCMCYRKGEMTGKNQPWISIDFEDGNSKKVDCVAYYSYSTSTVAEKAQVAKNYGETLTVSGVSYKFNDASINDQLVTSYQDMLNGLSSVSSFFKSTWVYTASSSDVEMKVHHEEAKGRTELQFWIYSPKAPK